ncbi:MAG: outer membrane lipoprotein-sorting protein [Flavobacteriales bacterium]
MKQLFTLFSLLLLLLSLFLPTWIIAQDAKAIVEEADRKLKGSSSYSEISLEIIRPSYKRSMKLSAWTLGDDRLFIRINEPVKEKGTVFLRRGKEVWNWIPSIERSIKLPPSMMSQSWMGSDFTNDDLVKEGSMVKDYEHTLEAEEIVDGHACYRIRLTPHEDAAVVWGAVVLWIEKKEKYILKATYHDEDGELMNTMIGSDARLLGGKTIPTRMEMHPEGKPGNKTILTYSELRFEIGLKEDFFSPQRLGQ